MKSSSDFGAGALLTGASLYFLILGRNLERGTAFQMGPGFFPTATAVLTLVVGLILIVKALRIAGPPAAPVRILPAALVLASILAFTALIEVLGLVVTGTITMFIAGAAAARSNRIRMLAVCLAVSLGAGLLFVKALGVSMPLWPAL
ncbi:MAG: tripartite tricarboxylate transporter TctB family protein [Alphaproteobacteria bacterium]|nr:tripartite tricarboxylate transporter TctB family protein [Alphaproteobacteria bacterium]